MNFTLFADDTSMYQSHQHLTTTLIEEVNNENKKITQWFHTNKLSLNIKKTNYIIFASVNKKYNIPSQAIQINGSAIPKVNFFKFLDVCIDEHLNWSMHLNKLATKLAQIGILCKLKHFLPSNILKTIYCFLVLQHLQYCTLIWANTKLNNIRMLQRLLGSLTHLITLLTLNRHLNRTIYKKKIQTVANYVQTYSSSNYVQTYSSSTSNFHYIVQLLLYLTQWNCARLYWIMTPRYIFLFTSHLIYFFFFASTNDYSLYC